MCAPAGARPDDDSSEVALHALQGGVKLMTRLLHEFPHLAAIGMTEAKPSATAVLLRQVQVRSAESPSLQPRQLPLGQARSPPHFYSLKALIHVHAAFAVRSAAPPCAQVQILRTCYYSDIC
jgi:hypothetical protein